jgi:Vitamin K epoxide reductase family
MLNSITPDELGRELREGYGPFLKRRRGIIGLCFFSCGVLGAVALYQIGILKKLPEPRGRAFDTAKVNGSGEAYSILATPDAFLGLASYAVTAALVGMGSENRSRTHPWIPIAMGAKLLADSAMAAKLTVDEATKFRAFSLLSVLTAAATWIAVPLALPEAVAAVRQLKRQDRA